MHPSTTEALRAYARLRDRLRPSADTPAFFLTRMAGGSRRSVHEMFSKLIREVGLEGAGQRVRPRPHDLRHAFAVRTLLDWHRAGARSSVGCHGSPHSSATPTRQPPTGIWRRCPSCSNSSAGGSTACLEEAP